METLNHVTHGAVKLGRNAVKRPLKMLSMSNYMRRASTVPYPPVCALERPGPAYGMLGNDTIGDCTVAAALHMQMVWAGVARNAEVPTFTNDQAVTIYSAVAGYVPGDESTDNGAVETTVLDYWKQTGMVGNQIAGYVAMDITNPDMVKAATYLFGGLYIGIQVPAYIMNVEAGGSWSDNGSSRSIVGGHAIPICGYGRDGYRIISWGTTYTFNQQFWNDYVEEAYAVVDPLWFKLSGITPTGLDLTSLLGDLKSL